MFFYRSYSYYLYSISHPNRQGVPLFDLSGDETINIDISELPSKQLAVERVITKVFQMLRCNVIITDRIRSLFTTKLHRMGSSLQMQGEGRGKSKLHEKWKQTDWVVELRKDEIVSRKRQPENLVPTRKITKLEGELKESKAKLRNATNQIHLLEQSIKKLSSALAESGSSTVRHTCKKRWSEQLKTV